MGANFRSTALQRYEALRVLAEEEQKIGERAAAQADSQDLAGTHETRALALPAAPSPAESSPRGLLQGGDTAKRASLAVWRQERYAGDGGQGREGEGVKGILPGQAFYPEKFIAEDKEDPSTEHTQRPPQTRERQRHKPAFSLHSPAASASVAPVTRDMGEVEWIGDPPPGAQVKRPEDESRDQEGGDEEPQIGGVGINLMLRETPPFEVVSVVPGGPASHAVPHPEDKDKFKASGDSDLLLRARDRLMTVDGRDVSQMRDIAQVSALFRGPVGTPVEMSVVRPGFLPEDDSGRHLRLTVVRGPVPRGQDSALVPTDSRLTAVENANAAVNPGVSTARALDFSQGGAGRELAPAAAEAEGTSLEMLDFSQGGASRELAPAVETNTAASVPGTWIETKLRDGSTVFVNHELKSYSRVRPDPTVNPPPQAQTREIPSGGAHADTSGGAGGGESDRSATEERLVELRERLERLQEEKRKLERAGEEGGIGLQLGFYAAGSG